TRLLLGHPKTIEYAASLLQLGQPWADMRDDLVRLSGEGPLAVNDEMLSRVITLLERRAPAVRDLLDAWLVFEDSARESVWRKIAVNSGADQRSVKAQLDAALNELHGAALIDRHGQAGDTRCIMHSLLVAHLRRRHAMLSEEKMRELVQTQLIEQARLAREDHYPAGESGNIRRVVQVAERLGLWRNLVDYCVAVVGQQGLPLVRRGPWALARELLDAAVRAAAECADQEWQARFLLVRGTVEYRLAAFESAARAYEQAAALADAAGARSLRLQALRGVGQVHYRTGDLLAAERLYHTARILAEDDESSMADIDHQLAKILYRKGRLNEARDLLTRVRATRERSGHDRDLAKTIHEQARIEHVAGQGERARALYEEALRLERQVKDPVMEQATLFQLARLALDRGSTAEAQDLFSDSRRISEELGDQVWIVHAQFGQALLDWDQGNRDSALQQGKTALSESRKLRIGLTAEIQEWLDTHLDSVPRGSE
ncbi:MAG: tetratricopeptide repeat protein, partial [Pseudonocardiaceae bacterium]